MPLAAAIIPSAISGVASLFGAKKASDSATQAAKLQSDAANRAADLQKQAADDSLAFSKQQYSDQVARQQPWLQSGQDALAKLQSYIDNGGGPQYGKSFTAPADFQFDKFTGPADFQAPNGVTLANDPGYQFRLAEAQKGILRGAAAGGGAFTGGTLRKLGDISQNVASDEYSKVFDRAAQTYASNFQKNLAGYNTNYNTAKGAYDTNFGKDLQSYQTDFNRFNTEQGNAFNRLSALAGGGQTAINNLGAEGAGLASNVTGVLNNSAANIGNYLTQGANAQSAGKIASGNAYQNAFGGIAANLLGGSQYGSQPGGAFAALMNLRGNRNGGVGYSAPSNGYYNNYSDEGGNL